MEYAKITRDGNLLDITPAHENLLGSQLTYQHRQINAGMEAVSFGPVSVYEHKLYRIKNNHLFVNQGALQRVINVFNKAGIKYVFEDLRKKTYIKPDYESLKLHLPRLEFRVKQADVLAHLVGYDSGVIVAPTAYGKTFIMTSLAALYPRSNIIITSPGTALLNSTYKRILKITGEVGRIGGGYNTAERVTLSTFRSLMRAPVERCDILLIDEVHEAAASEVANTLATIRSPVKIFGMTATPEGRSDNAELLIECLIGPKLIEITYDEVAKSGAIAPIKVAMLSLPREQCPIQIKGAYQSQVAKKRNGYWRNIHRNRLFADAVRYLPQQYGLSDPQTLVLAKTLEHALRLKKLLPEYTVIYASLSKQQKEKLNKQGLLPKDYKALTKKQREQLLTEFEDGTLRKVIATGCWGQGIDPIHLEFIVNASGESSKILSTQWAGRNSRLNPNKTFGLVADCLDEWDTWAQSRAYRRRKTYREHNWEIAKVKEFRRE